MKFLENPYIEAVDTLTTPEEITRFIEKKVASEQEDGCQVDDARRRIEDKVSIALGYARPEATALWRPVIEKLLRASG